jgi:hypothetical protein
MTESSARLSRAVLLALAATQLGTGSWALVAPTHWYRNYPGFGRHWLTPAGPFNEHLSADAGAGFLATGAALLIASIWFERRVVQTALIVFLAQAIPHFLHHITHPVDAYSALDVVVGVWGIAFEAAIAMAALIVVSRAQDPLDTGTRSHDHEPDKTASRRTA